MFMFSAAERVGDGSVTDLHALSNANVLVLEHVVTEDWMDCASVV